MYESATANQYDNSYLLNLKDVKDLFSLSESIYQSGLVEWVQPDFISASLHNNPLYPQQYYLNNTGQNGATANIDINAPEAWSLLQNCTGNPRVRVAVLDEGVETHDDLTNLSPNGYDDQNRSNLGRPLYAPEFHGQACAGIIGADNNTIGMRGVATNVEIIPARIFVNAGGGATPYSYSAREIARTIDWAWNPLGGNADILSNSWGAAGATPDINIIAAIQRARIQGRDGKGCVVIFSSGNRQLDIPGVAFPGNVNGVITVGAINKNGAIWDYSGRGAEMDLVAPSGEIYERSAGDVATLDRMGANGLVAGNYLTDFGGTSAAAPQVAGVAALMLQANPNLTEVEVRTILQQTARDLGTAGFDNDTGYGLVDAEKAVKRVLAGDTKISPTSVSRICLGASGVVSLLDVPVGAVVTWQASNGVVSPSSGVGTVATITPTGRGFTTITFTMTPTTTSCIRKTFSQSVYLGDFLPFPAGQGWTGNQNPTSIGSVVTYTYPLPLAGSYQSFSCFATPAGQVPPLEDARGTYQFPWQVLSCGITNGQMSVQVVIGSGIGSVGFNVLTSCGIANFGILVEVPMSDPNNPPDCSYKFNLAYPNPTNDFLTVARPKPPRPPACNPYPWLPFQLKLYDGKGILQREIISEGDNATLNVAELQRGLYVLHIIHSDKIEQKRILLE